MLLFILFCCPFRFMMNLSLARCFTRRGFFRSSVFVASNVSRCHLRYSAPLLRLNQPEESGPSGWWKKCTSFFSRTKSQYSRVELSVCGENLYILCAEYPEFSEFVRVLRLPDTYQSWLSITFLHAWLCMVRIRREGDDGRIVRDVFFKTLFDDVERRTRGFSLADKERDIGIVQKQFYGALFGYDEALLSEDDRVLAGTLWRDFFHMQPDTRPEDLECMVAYTRKQLPYLDEQSSDQILRYGYVKFLPLIGDYEDENYVNRRVSFALKAPSIQEMKKDKKKKQKSDKA